MPTEQSYELVHESPILDVPWHIEFSQFPEAQSAPVTHLPPFGAPPLGPHVFMLAHVPDRQSLPDEHAVPSVRCGSQTATLAPEISVLAAQLPTAHFAIVLHVSRQPGVAATPAPLPGTVEDTQTAPLGQSESCLQDAVHTPLVSVKS